MQSRTVVCGDSLTAFVQNQTYLNFSVRKKKKAVKKHGNISQKWFYLAHILLSTQVRIFILPLAFLHERISNPVQAEGKYKPAENSLLTMCILFCYSVVIVNSRKNKRKKTKSEREPGDINFVCNFGDAV